MVYAGIGCFPPPVVSRRAGYRQYWRHALAELGLALLLVAVLLLTDPERVDWVARKVRDFVDWLGTE